MSCHVVYYADRTVCRTCGISWGANVVHTRCRLDDYPALKPRRTWLRRLFDWLTSWGCAE